MGKILLTLTTAILKNPNKVPALDSYKKVRERTFSMLYSS